jgi:hypothetical protein
MVKKLLSTAIVGSAAVVGACFGDGPTPSAPSSATILLSGTPIQNCNSGTYIGTVAVGSNQGYVTTLPFIHNGGPNPPGCDNGGGGAQVPMVDQNVFSFNLDGGTLMKLGSAGMSGQGWRPQITADGSGYRYAWTQTASQPSGTYLEPDHMQVGSGNFGTEYPLGIAADGSDVWVALQTNATTGGQSEPDNPEYPCCGSTGGGVGSGAIWKVGTGAVGTWQPFCLYTDRCFVAASGMLYYFELGQMSWKLTSLPGGGGTPGTLAVGNNNDGLVPAGLDASAGYVAFTTAPRCDNMSGNCDYSLCNVFVYDTAMQKLTTLLSTHQFGCMDAKIADGFVYFAITGVDQHTQHMFGRGIGRIAIADRTFESLDLGIQGDAAGPRRIFPLGNQLFLVDPLVMARIDASAIAGKQDIAP